MKRALQFLVLVLLLATSGFSQNSRPPDAEQQPKWRRSLLNLPSAPPPNTRPQDLYRLERDMRAGLPYLRSAGSADYEANRELARRVATYLMGVQVLANDPQMRRALGRVQRTAGLLPYYGMTNGAVGQQQPDLPPPVPMPDPGERKPPFSLGAPALPPLSGEAQTNAANLCTRYENAAARAMAAWQNAESLRLSLASQGAVLNSQTAADVARLEIYFTTATRNLQAQNWDGAQTQLERAEYTTERILKVVGR